ncbi:DUF5993 family protein [Ruegeria haliotis]|nr:DUF5993 family protein [Ruegeria haliotis]
MSLPDEYPPDSIPLFCDRRTEGENRAMIALLFALLTAVMGLNYFKRTTAANTLFFITLALSVYWLKFHATSQLTIQL